MIVFAAIVEKDVIVVLDAFFHGTCDQGYEGN
jgi:hypothetical protein